jgi:hypothetical protein
MNIERFGFEQTDLVVVTAVNAYLKKLTPGLRKEMLKSIVISDGVKTLIDGAHLADLIENSKTAAMIGSVEWKDCGDPLMKKTLDFIHEILSTIDGKKYVKDSHNKFLKFIVSCAAEA